MASEGATTGQPHLHKQDLAKLDVSKLTALSPEVISRQATINIGTIGHVAHGKSTVVKAISGVQTVRFKNELERNITIKLGMEGEKQEEEREEEEAGMKANITVEPEEISSHGKEPLPSLASRVPRKRKACQYTRRRKPRNRKKRLWKDEDTGKELSESEDSDVTLGRQDDGKWEVERILNHDVINGKRCFLVKWKSWGSCYNSWEPLENLVGCQELIIEYFKKNRCEEFEAKLKKEPTKEQIRKKALDITSVDKDTLEQYMITIRSNGKLQNPVLSEEEVNKKIKAVICESVPQKLKEAKDAILAQAFERHRKQQLLQLFDWQNEMNLLTPNEATIRVENDFDLEVAPIDFNYVVSYIPGAGVEIPDEPPLFCSCVRCDGRGTCKTEHDTHHFAYDKRGRLLLPPGLPIFECNKYCLCDQNCLNRVVQKGRQVELCIFRTGNGCGWGVKAMQNIPKGTFVCQYVGEVITSEEAEERGAKYDAEGHTYLFDLDFNEPDNCKFTVDAAVYGNIAHFINHSCDPNCVVYSVWVNCLDPNLPLICLFASRDINEQEQITFDYSLQISQGDLTKLNHSRMSKSMSFDHNESFSSDKSKTECRCGASKCRKYLF